MRSLAVIVPLVLAGCTVGPDFKTPDPPAVKGYTARPLPPSTASARVAGGAAQQFVSGEDIAADWWHVFHSKAAEHPGRAGARRQSQSSRRPGGLTASAGERGRAARFLLPVGVGRRDASRNLTPEAAVSPASASGSPYYSLITPQLNVSFVPDVFGANRRAVESLQAQADNQRFMLEATWLTLTSNVVAGAIQEASLRGQIKATEETIRVEIDLLKILKMQQKLGQVTGADVAAQEASLAQAQLNLPPLQKQLAQQRDALTTLAGKFPSEEIAQTFDLDTLHLPVRLPLSLPSNLVRQRPDVRQAEENLHAASANIGQAVAARLPQITLTAQVGNSANSASGLFKPGTNFWTLEGGLTQPIFEGFTLLHKQRAAQAAFDQAAAQYRGTVLTAFQNVADAMRALHSDADALADAAASERAAARSLDITRKQLQLGQIAYLSVLNAQNTYAQARLALVQAQASRLADTAALFQALGGGWWHRPADPTKTSIAAN